MHLFALFGFVLIKLWHSGELGASPKLWFCRGLCAKAGFLCFYTHCMVGSIMHKNVMKLVIITITIIVIISICRTYSLEASGIAGQAWVV